MTNPFNHPAMVDISLLAGRLTLGLNLLLAGWGKIAGGIGKFVDKGFMPLRPDWLPEAVARPYGYAIPVLELATGLLVVLGLFTRWAGGIMALMLLSIFVALVTEHGLNGGEKAPIHFSIILASMAFIIAIVGPGRLALDPLYFGGGNASGGGRAK